MLQGNVPMQAMLAIVNFRVKKASGFLQGRSTTVRGRVDQFSNKKIWVTAERDQVLSLNSP
jgi:hypothetical protein